MRNERGENLAPEKMSEKPPRRLFLRIVNRIRAEKKLAASKRKTVYFLLALGGSFVAFMAACAAVQSALVQSELIRIFSLLVSDPVEIVANWRDFGLFVIESLPVTAFAIFLVTLLALLESAKYAIKNMADILSSRKQIHLQSRAYGSK
jgi:hypothetical protein